jgi:hypothetical protein
MRKIEGRQIVTAAIGNLERRKLTDAARQHYLSSYGTALPRPGIE